MFKFNRGKGPSGASMSSLLKTRLVGAAFPPCSFRATVPSELPPFEVLEEGFGEEVVDELEADEV